MVAYFSQIGNTGEEERSKVIRRDGIFSLLGIELMVPM